jgi:hypothetical protein
LRRGLSPRAALAAALVSMMLGACGSSPAPARVCLDDAPSACPSPAPHFAADAAPIIAAHCAKCHTPGGPSEKFPFETYDQIAPYAGDMKLELETCEMPPATEPPLSEADRQTLFGWITCGALDD